MNQIKLLPGGGLGGVLLLVLLLLGLPLPSLADPPAEVWKSQPMAKQPVGALLSVATSPDGKYRVDFADVGDKGVPTGYPLYGTRLLDSSGKVLALWRRLGPAAAVFSPDSAHLAVGTESGTVHLISVKDRKVVNTFKTIAPKMPIPGVMIGIGALVFAPTTAKLTLVAAHDDGSIAAWEPTSGKQLATLAHGQQAGVILLPGPKDSLLAIVGQEVRKTDFALKKWDAQFKLPARVVNMTASADNRLLALAAFDRSVTILDTETLKPVQTMKEKGQAVPMEIFGVPGFTIQFPLALSPKGDRLFTTTPEENGGTITVWDVKTGKKAGSFNHPMPRATLGNPTLHMSATADGKVKTFWSNINVSPVLLWSLQPEKKE